MRRKRDNFGVRKMLEYSLGAMKRAISEKAPRPEHRPGTCIIESLENRQLLSVSMLTPPQVSVAGPTYNNAGGWFPADSSQAAGPNALVSTTNSAIQFNDRSGTPSTPEALTTFFASLTPLPNTALNDTHVVYDQYNGRFVVETDEIGSSTSRILLAVSQTNSPYGSWWFSAFNSSVNVNGTSCWADYPALAVSQDAVYITANMFAFGGGWEGTRLWIVNKTPLYSGGTIADSVYDPATAVGHTGDFTLQPAEMFGTAPGSTGTFLVATMNGGSVLTDGSGNDLVDVIRVDNPTSSPAFSAQYVNVGGIEYSGAVPPAPQRGSTYTIDVGDQRALRAVWRNNSLYLSNTIDPLSGADAGQATAHWYQINTTTLGSLSLSQQGNVGAEDLGVGTYTYYPSITVNKVGDVGISFSASSSNLYAGSYYTARASTDGLGTTRSTQTIASGQDSYYLIEGNGDTRNRWGDFSSVSIDPSDDLTFWAFNQYAVTKDTSQQIGSQGRWATSAGSFDFSSELGVFNSATGTWSMDSNGDRRVDYGDSSFSFGGSGETAVIGDWNGNGTKKLGVYQPSTGTWYLDMNGNGVWDPQNGDIAFVFGGGAETPVVGKWNGGSADEVGVYDPNGRVFYLDYNGNHTWDPTNGDISFAFNPVTGGTLVPIAGDWNGDGKTDVGVWNQSTGIFYLDSNGDHAWDTGDASFQFGTFTGSGDQPIVGDWNGDGVSDVGIYNAGAGTFYLDSNSDHAWGGSDPTIPGWGTSGYQAVIVS